MVFSDENRSIFLDCHERHQIIGLIDEYVAWLRCISDQARANQPHFVTNSALLAFEKGDILTITEVCGFVRVYVCTLFAYLSLSLLPPRSPSISLSLSPLSLSLFLSSRHTHSNTHQNVTVFFLRMIMAPPLSFALALLPR